MQCIINNFFSYKQVIFIIYFIALSVLKADYKQSSVLDMTPAFMDAKNIYYNKFGENSAYLVHSLIN